MTGVLHLCVAAFTCDQSLISSRWPVFSSQIIISTDVDGTHAVYAADMDGDGDMDVLTASWYDNKIAWYRNEDGAGTFSSQIIISTAADAATGVYAADMDGDGDMDVLSASWFDDKIAWYRNEDGAGTFSSQIIISTAADSAQSVYAADLDGDGDMDVLSASAGDSKIAWYRNMDEAGTFSSQIVISTDGARSVYAADLDGDGDMDVLSASWWNDRKIAWYRNEDGTGTFSSQIVISTDADGSSSVYAADLDGDGDMDVLSASRWDDKIAWYRNMDGAGTFSSQIVISTAAVGASSVYAADMDGDGDMDVLSAAGVSKIAWYRNEDGAGTFSSQIIISSTAVPGGGIYAADLDGDGDMDVLSKSYRDDNRIAWYRNMAKPTVDVSLHFLGANYTHYTNASSVNQAALQCAVQTDVLAAVPDPTAVRAVVQSVSDGSTPGRAAMELEIEVMWESLADVVTDASSWAFDTMATVINEHWCDTPPCTVVVVATPSPSTTPSTTPSASATPSQTPSASATPSQTPSASATPSQTPSVTPSPTPSPRPWCDLEASTSLPSTAVTVIHNVTIPGGSYSQYATAPGPDHDEFRCSVMTDAMLAVPDSTRATASVAVTGGNDTSLHLQLTISWFSPADVPPSVSWSFPSAAAAVLSFGWCEAASCPVTVVPSPSVTPSPAAPSTDSPTGIIVAASLAVAVCLVLGISGTVYAIRRGRCSRTAKQTHDHPPNSPTSASTPPIIHVTSLASQEPDLDAPETQKPGALTGPAVVAPAPGSGLPPPQYAAEASPPGYSEGEEPSSAAPPAYSDDDNHVPAVL